jgi:hypothetical protein
MRRAVKQRCAVTIVVLKIKLIRMNNYKQVLILKIKPVLVQNKLSNVKFLLLPPMRNFVKQQRCAVMKILAISQICKMSVIIPTTVITNKNRILLTVLKVSCLVFTSVVE